jgi:hypothetical protein
MQLDPRDIDDGGDVILERTLLLLDERMWSYLLLFPLSLSPLERMKQGIFFLNDLTWAERAVRLKKARYIAYDWLPPHYDAPAGEGVVSGLDRFFPR